MSKLKPAGWRHADQVFRPIENSLPDCSLPPHGYHRGIRNAWHFATGAARRSRHEPMPELPEVETMRRGIAGVAGLRIVAVDLPRETKRPILVRPRPAALARALAGRTVAGVHRFGKRIAIEIDGDETRPQQWLVIEPRMTGMLLIGRPPTDAHIRIVLEFASRKLPRLLFWDRRGLGTARLLDEAGLQAACGPAKLGPDGLGVSAADLQARLSQSRRAVKVALLDQRIVAGIGNIYAAEILSMAGVDPRAACRRLSETDWDRIALASRTILADAVSHEGSSLGDATYQTPDNRFGSFQDHHRVYGRENQPCRDCGNLVVRVVQAQRATFFCPDCQWRPRRRRVRLQKTD
jgi:formamidopyrimidine-DNA glycosylase